MSLFDAARLSLRQIGGTGMATVHSGSLHLWLPRALPDWPQPQRCRPSWQRRDRRARTRRWLVAGSSSGRRGWRSRRKAPHVGHAAPQDRARLLRSFRAGFGLGGAGRAILALLFDVPQGVEGDLKVGGELGEIRSPWISFRRACAFVRAGRSRRRGLGLNCGERRRVAAQDSGRHAVQKRRVMAMGFGSSGRRRSARAWFRRRSQERRQGLLRSRLRRRPRATAWWAFRVSLEGPAMRSRALRALNSAISSAGQYRRFPM